MAVPEGATKLGTVGIAYKGVYDELVTYKYANAVYYNGSTYIALIDNPAGFPSNDGVNWRYLAQGFLQQAVSALTVIDESGILGEVDAEVNAQEFLSKIAELEQGLEDTKANKADILGTLEEIVANTEGGRIAGANAVSELNSNFSKINNIKTIDFVNGVSFKWTVAGLQPIIDSSEQLPLLKNLTNGNGYIKAITLDYTGDWKLKILFNIDGIDYEKYISLL